MRLKLTSDRPFKTCIKLITWHALQDLASISDNSVSIAHPQSNEELREALFSMRPLKEPGPDNFHLIFFKRNGILWTMTFVRRCKYKLH